MAGRNREKICENLSFAAKEAFKRLRNNVENAFDPDGKTGFVVGVTSAQPSEGKSTVSVNLAYSLAEHGQRVILVDSDLRRSSIHSKLGLQKMPGLREMLVDNAELSACIQTYTSSKSETSFDVIPGGNPPENPSELLDSPGMDALLDVLSRRYDAVILDLPPVGAVVDAVSVARRTDGMLVVIRENNCPRGVFIDCVDQLESAGANILGFVMNGALEGAGKNYQYGYY